jgi:glycine reductase
MTAIRALYYVNQFFAGIGGEDKADTALGFSGEPLGPAKRFQELSQGAIQIVRTAYCGDNYFADNEASVLAAVSKMVREDEISFVIAGPAFGSGRYGFACIELCHSLTSSMNVPCVSGMHIENPGVELYQQYKDKKIFVVPTSDGALGMGAALEKMARLSVRVAEGKVIGSAEAEGYIPRGFRLGTLADKTGVERALDMLLDKVADRSFSTEIPIETVDEIPVAPPIADLQKAHLALLSTAGVVAPGNPDGFKTNGNTQWKKYSIEQLDSMSDAPWDVWHGGYNTVFMHENPNYGVPLDGVRDRQKEGVVGKLNPFFYSIPGSFGQISVMQKIGKEILADMNTQGINGALLVST